MKRIIFSESFPFNQYQSFQYLQILSQSYQYQCQGFRHTSCWSSLNVFFKSRAFFKSRKQEHTYVQYLTLQLHSCYIIPYLWHTLTLPNLQGDRERKATWPGDLVLVELIYWWQAWLLWGGGCRASDSPSVCRVWPWTGWRRRKTAHGLAVS